MEELIEKMAVILQWIFDDGEGGSYRPHIQEVLVAYNAAQQGVQPTNGTAGDSSLPNVVKVESVLPAKSG